MKKTLLSLSFIIPTFLTATAQYTNSERFVLDVKINNQRIATFKKGNCGFSAANDWGGPVNEDICLPIVWAYDDTLDSLCCGTISNDYSGKMVMIRRGECEFGQKGLNAQNAGAKAVAIANTATNGNNECDASKMVAGNYGALVNIPQLMFSYKMAYFMDSLLQAGQQPEICFRRLMLHSPTAEYSYATPAAQKVPVEQISMRLINRTGIGQEFVGKCRITAPNSSTVEYYTNPVFVAADADSLLKFPNVYQPPAELLGKYTLQFSADKVTGLGDSLQREFEITENIWAKDNFNLVPNTMALDPFFSWKVKHGVLYKTGTGGELNGIQFGIENAAQVADTIEPLTNIITGLVYDADKDNDHFSDLDQNSLYAFGNLDIIAYFEMPFDRNTPNQLLYSYLTPIGNNLEVKPNHLYYVTLQHDNSNNLTHPSRYIKFKVSEKVNYEDGFAGLHTPVELNTSVYDGIEQTTVIRLLTTPPPASLRAPLEKIKYTVAPNPADEAVTINLQLARTNQSVVVRLLHYDGSLVQLEKYSQFQNGSVTLSTQNLPSGKYLMQVQTSDEGSALIPVMVCH